MGESLNTTVNGSVGTCVEAADYLRAIYQAASMTVSGFQSARATADATWVGPAHDEFNAKATQVGGEIDTLGDGAFGTEWALRDFADALKAVLGKMDDALAKAAAGGLRVDGPFIATPDPLPAAPVLPTGPCGTAQAGEVVRQNQQAIAAHNELVAVYNAKVAVYNECKAIVTQARTMEGNAHDALAQAMGKTSATVDTDLVSIGFTAASQTRGFVGTMENGQRLARAEATRLTTQASFYQNLALGKQADYPIWAKSLLDRSATMAEDGGKYQTRAQQFERWVKVMPEDWRRKVVAYPGMTPAENTSSHSKDPKLPAGAARLARSMPYVGSMLTAGNEVYGAYKGEQSWGRAVADTTATIVGGGVGGALVGAAAGSAFGPVGALVLGVAGGFGGAKFATDIVAGFSAAQE